MKHGQASRNALAGAVQTILSAGLMFVFYRVILDTVGADGLGVWSVVLATTNAARVSELGLSGSAVKYTAGRLARGDHDAASRVIETTVLTVGALIAVAAGVAYVGIGAVLPAIIPSDGLKDAIALLPYACVSFWLTSIAGALQSGLDGCGRIDLRNAIVFGGQLLYVALGIWLVQERGIIGLALAQIAQGIALVVAVWIGIRIALPAAPIVPRRWDRGLFREMLRYGLSFQALSLLRMLFEPTTKVLMSRFGGLSAAGFYEMATLLVTKLRALVVAAQQALTPEIAFIQERQPERVNAAYARVNGISGYVTVPLFAGVIASAPFVSHLWVGHYEPMLVLFVVLLAAGWLVNTLTGPAFFLLLGTGEMRGVVVSHVTIALVNAGLGAALGWAFGAIGVALGWVVALGAGAVHLLWILQKDRGVTQHLPDPKGITVGLPLVIAAFGLGAALIRPESLVASMGVVGVVGVALALTMWASPYRMQVIDLLRSALGKA
ncbi:MAG: oligosaccharide flippase family protein [Bacteroidota bacterium]